MTTSQGSSPSFTTEKKKQINDDKRVRLVVIYYTWKKKKRWQRASWLIVIFYTWGGKKTKRWQQATEAHRHVLHLKGKKKRWKLVIIFCTWKKNQTICSLFTFFNLLAIYALLLEERFLQHHFSNVFCSTISTPFMQHRLLQHCFNTTFAIFSSTVALQHCFYSTVFCNIAFVFEWWQGLGFLVGQR
jgi:hypothetical protein